MNKLVATFIVVISVVSTFAEPTVTDVVAKHRYPWNGPVDITCNVSGVDETTMVAEYKRMMIPKEVLQETFETCLASCPRQGRMMMGGTRPTASSLSES